MLHKLNKKKLIYLTVSWDVVTDGIKTRRQRDKKNPPVAPTQIGVLIKKV